MIPFSNNGIFLLDTIIMKMMPNDGILFSMHKKTALRLFLATYVCQLLRVENDEKNHRLNNTQVTFAV